MDYMLVIDCRQLTQKKRETIQSMRFFTVSADEVTTIENSTWVSVTIYYIDDWGRESMMCGLEHVEEGATSNNLTKVIMKAVQALTAMSREEVAKKMIAFGAGEFLDLFQLHELHPTSNFYNSDITESFA
jgi:hypothetical protein